ncbi:MAG: hypothetical protein IKN57_13995 [Parasporobacterium sp.]|nr:hypothetical protein [Parasporobacterium sp.]
MMRAAFLFGFFGFGAKAAVFPLHGWLPEASAAPSPVTALLHAVAVVNTGVFAVIRLVWYVFGPGFLAGTSVQAVCSVTVSFTVVYAAVMALKERHFKRRLAYSTVSNLSYMLFGVLLATREGLLGGMAHMLFHGTMKMLLFLCAGSFLHETGHAYLYEINGAGKRMPVTFACYTLGALSLTGIPGLCGFISKWKLIEAAVADGSVYALAGLLCLITAALLCAIYSITVSIRAFFPPSGTVCYPEEAAGQDCHTKGQFPEDADGSAGRPAVCFPEGRKEPGWRMMGPILLFALGNIFFGLYPEPVLRFLEKIAAGSL